MSFDVKVDASKCVQQLEHLAREIPGAIEAGMDRAGMVVKMQSYRQIHKLYATAIPTLEQHNAYRRNGKRIARKKIGGAGRKAWVRSRDLAKSEAVVNVGPGERAIDSVGPAEKYAERRHNLGLTWFPKAPSMGKIRNNWWRLNALNISEPQVQPAFLDEFRKRLGI